MRNNSGVISKGGLIILALVAINLCCNVCVAQNVVAWGRNTDGQTNVPPEATNIIVVASGAFHNLAIKNDDTVLAWGKNWNGQTNVPPGLTNVVAVAAGGDHSLALRNDGSVVAWGKNLDGQASVPASATNVIAIAAGWTHSVALRADGSIIAWGNNEYGQASVSFLASQVISIACGYYHTLALHSDGTVVSWGYLTDVPLSATNVTAIAAGWGHNLALRSDGTIVAWGDNTYGQATVPSTATNVIAIAAGWYHSMALRADGTIISWGKGNGFSDSVTNVPAGLSGIAGISAGEDFCAAVTQSGVPQTLPCVTTLTTYLGGQMFFNPVVASGGPASYQWTQNGIPIQGATNQYLLRTNVQNSDAGTYALIISNGSTQSTNPVVAFNVAPASTYSLVGAWGGSVYNADSSIPAGITNPIAIAAGDYHNLILQADGTVIACGNNLYNQANVPADLTNATAVAAGYYFNLALRSDQTVEAWGRNSDGQTNVPSSATNVVAIAARDTHALALRSDGTVIAWGNNDFGQTNVPVDLKDVIAISAGYGHNLALRSDHTVVNWGSQYLTPPSATNVIAIAAGYEHSLALRSDGSLVAWGDNSFGQCTIPPFVTNAIAVSAGWWHSLALLADGTLVAWGQISTPLTNANNHAIVLAQNIPTGLNNVAKIASGTDHDLALVTYGPPDFDVIIPPRPVRIGDSPVLAASGGGTFPMAFQWYRNGNPVSGATNRWLQLSNIQKTNYGSYVLIASNACGQVSSMGTNMMVQFSPYFLSPCPAQMNYLPGNALSLSANVTGKPLYFLAQLNGSTLSDGSGISGTATPTITFNPTTFQDSGILSMVVTNYFGAYTGLLANLTITPVAGWGDNSSLQLQPPASVMNVAALASGGDHSLALLANGTVLGWGDNSYGQNNVPLSANQAVAIAEGDTHSLALRADGSVVAWGDNSSGQTTVPASVQNAVAIAAGAGLSYALMPDGRIIQWGMSSLTYSNAQTMMISAKGTNFVVLLSGGRVGDNANDNVPLTNAISVCAGGSYALALLADGSLASWQWGNHIPPILQTNIIPAFAKSIVSIAAGDDHFLALRSDGVVVAWGNTNFSQCTVPTLTQSVGMISAGSVHSLAALGQPYQRAARIGDTVVLSAGQLGNRLSTYQWQFNGVNINGATNATLALANVNWTNSGTYRVIVSNTSGSVISPAMSLTIPTFQFDASSLSYSNTDGSFSMKLKGASGNYPVVFLASTNLSDWVPIFTNPPTTNLINFFDIPANPGQQKFYRAVEQH
jgi:alpha-tubulin suppressor-like RCC1 family protein